MPAYWLAKSEPDVFSWDDLKKAPKRTTDWTNVRNFRARTNLKTMKLGDLAFFYHSNADPSAIVGVMEVVREAYPDRTQFDKASGEVSDRGRTSAAPAGAAKNMGYDPKATPEKPIWYCVDVRYKQDLPRPVSLHEVKANPKLSEMQLVRIARLSVQKVTPEEWRTVLAMADRPAPAEPAKKPARKKAARAKT